MLKDGRWFLFLIMASFAVGFVVSFQRQALLTTADVLGLANISTGIIGDKKNLVSFSIPVGGNVSGLVSYKGEVKGGYFFEANILVNILDKDKKLIKQGNGIAMTDWMTAGPVAFEGNLDFTGLPAGKAYIEIRNDNASGLSENDKRILIPVLVE